MNQVVYSTSLGCFMYCAFSAGKNNHHPISFQPSLQLYYYLLWNLFRESIGEPNNSGGENYLEVFAGGSVRAIIGIPTNPSSSFWLMFWICYGISIPKFSSFHLLIFSSLPQQWNDLPASVGLPYIVEYGGLADSNMQFVQSKITQKAQSILNRYA